MNKMGSFVYFPCFLPQLWTLNSPKKLIFFFFCNFVLTAAINLSLLKQFTYMHLKVLIRLFQKMIWFIGVWATANETLAIKASKKILNRNVTKILTSNPNISKTVSQHNKQYHFLRVRNDTFQMHICELL